MPKRYRQKRKNGYRKRRRFRRKKGLLVKPDGIHKEKITIVRDITINSGGSLGHLNVSWITPSYGNTISNFAYLDTNNT